MAWTRSVRLRLRQRRLDLGYSQVEVARQLGITTGHLSNIENGHIQCGRGLQERLETLLAGLRPKPRQRPLWSGREGFRARRLELGFSQLRVAAIVGVSPKMLMLWENGRKKPSASQQRLLAQTLRRLETAPPDARLSNAHNSTKASPEWHAALRARRNAAGLSAGDIATRVGMSASTVRDYENGRLVAAAFAATRIDGVIAREQARRERPA